jgi:hypothetical protein
MKEGGGGASVREHEPLRVKKDAKTQRRSNFDFVEVQY